MIWFTADTHFNHAAILTHTSRAFFSIKDHDDEIISTINQFVKPNDELWHLGDFCWTASKAGHYRQRINCRKIHCTRGNHDASSLARHMSSCEMLAVKKIGGRVISLCHYPLASWSCWAYGGLNLHGHCHNRLPREIGRLDVGLDSAFSYFGVLRPFSLDEVFEILTEKNNVDKPLSDGSVYVGPGTGSVES